MPSLTVNICVLTLVLLSFQQICQSRPHRSKRGLVKDYFVPDTLVFASDKFEKGEDGKYYLKKSAHRQDSEVNYMSADNAEKKNDIVPDVSEVETSKDDSKTVEAVSIKTGAIKKELLEKEAELVPSSALLKEAKVATDEIDIKNEKASFTPEDTKLTVPPKPDSKDEVALKTGLPLTESEEKIDEKVSIGQVPDLSSRLVPVPENIRIPILIPLRHISYRAMKIIPIPPAEVSDRLPVPYEDDIIGEGAHESESEGVSEPLAEKEGGYPMGNPLTSLLSFHNILKEIKEADKGDIEKESKVVDVLGKKFLVQSNVMKYPSSDNSNTFIRFMSMKPLEETKPEEPKDVAAEEVLKKELESEERKSIDLEKEESGAKENDEIKKEKDMKESEMKKEIEEKLVKETEILKAEETELKMKVEKNVPKGIILKNVEKEEASDEMKNVAKESKSVEEVLKETTAHKMPESELDDADLKQVMKSKEMGIIEKGESQLKVKESKDIVMKEEESKLEEEKFPKMDAESKYDDGRLKIIKNEKVNDKKMEVIDPIMRKYEEKKMDLDSKKDFFLQEKKKREKAMEEMEEAKQKKKSEKKKKKCKCEDKDSDSDDDGEE